MARVRLSARPGGAALAHRACSCRRRRPDEPSGEVPRYESTSPPCCRTKNKVAGFYAARSRPIPPLPWPTFAPPVSADEGAKHADRDARFEHINTMVKAEPAVEVRAAQAADEPVIPVDTRKKELVGAFRNGGSDGRPRGEPQRVKVHEFVVRAPGLGRPLRRPRRGRG